MGAEANPFGPPPRNRVPGAEYGDRQAQFPRSCQKDTRRAERKRQAVQARRRAHRSRERSQASRVHSRDRHDAAWRNVACGVQEVRPRRQAGCDQRPGAGAAERRAQAARRAPERVSCALRPADGDAQLSHVGGRRWSPRQSVRPEGNRDRDRGHRFGNRDVPRRPDQHQLEAVPVRESARGEVRRLRER